MQSVPSRISLKLFGFFEMNVEGRPVTHLTRRDADRLLAYLTLHHDHREESGLVAARLWPSNQMPANSLRQSVTHLRSLLGNEACRLETHYGGLSLDLRGVEADVPAFEAAVLRGDRASLEEAVWLYRGDLLKEWREEWVTQERQRLQKSYFISLRKLGRFCLQAGQDAEAADYLARYVKQHREEETVWRDLIQALLHCDERILARQRFAEYEAHLHASALRLPPAMLRLKQQIEAGLESQTAPIVSLPAIPVGGAVPLASPCYLRRPADSEFQDAIARRDSIVLVKGPRQAGKSSLLARGLAQARQNGVRVLATDLQKISARHWASTETFTFALAQHLADALELEQPPDADWSAHRGPIENFERYLRREVLGRSEAPLVWGLDEIDRLFPHAFSSELFGLFRALHNERALDPDCPWQRLTLVMAYATEAHLFISDLNISPFAVGTRVTLEDFAPRQVAELNRLYGTPVQGEALTALIQLLGGHPYLTNRGLYELASQRLRFTELISLAARPDGPFGDYLKRLLNALCYDDTLRQVTLAMVQRRGSPTSDDFYRLKSAGVLRGDTPENADFRCPLYRTYLEAHLR